MVRRCAAIDCFFELLEISEILLESSEKFHGRNSTDIPTEKFSEIPEKYSTENPVEFQWMNAEFQWNSTEIPVECH